MDKKELYKQMLVSELTVYERAERFEVALKAFIDAYQYQNVSLIDKASLKISVTYYEKLYSSIKPYIVKRTNCYKMASMTELAVIYIQPIFHENKDWRRILNAHFAFYSSVSLIESMRPEEFEKDFGNVNIEAIFNLTKQEHLEWLRIKNKDMMPVLSNAHTLGLLHHFYKHRWNSMQSH